MTILGKHYRIEHLPRVSITFFIIVSYVAIIILGGIFENFINPSNKELMTRLGDAFYLAVAYFLGRESRNAQTKTAYEDEDRPSKTGV